MAYQFMNNSKMKKNEEKGSKNQDPLKEQQSEK
jgi:hypothetical protein